MKIRFRVVLRFILDQNDKKKKLYFIFDIYLDLVM